jgi:hypothetical protein
MPSLSDNAAPQPSPAAETPGTTTPSSQSRPLSREEQADAEFNQLLESLKADVSRTKSPQQSSNVSESHLFSSSPSPSGPPQPPASIAPESLYPDSMSCRSAFDYAFFCQSFGGQFVNVYRYGELRSCSEHWDNFWLCMKARGMADEERKKVIRDHYRKKAVKYKTGPSRCLGPSEGANAACFPGGFCRTGEGDEGRGGSKSQRWWDIEPFFAFWPCLYCASFIPSGLDTCPLWDDCIIHCGLRSTSYA